MITKIIFKAILFLLLHNVESAFCVFCTYWDSFHRQYRSTYCPHACCLTAYSIEDSCCFGWSWWITVMTIAFPIIISFIVFIVLCLVFKRRRRINYPRGGVIMYVDPRRANFGAPPGSALFPSPPPNYNESNAAAAASQQLEERQRRLNIAKTGENGRERGIEVEGDAQTSSSLNDSNSIESDNPSSPTRSDITKAPKLPIEPPAYSSVVGANKISSPSPLSPLSVLTLSPRVFIRSEIKPSNDVLEMDPVTDVNETATGTDLQRNTNRKSKSSRKSTKSTKSQNKSDKTKKERDRSQSRSSLRSLRLTSAPKRDDEEHLNEPDQNEQ